jgi:hypothetical protein
MWEYHADINKVKASAIEMGKLGRTFDTCAIASDDSYLYAGSQSGDLLQINLQRNILKAAGARARLAAPGDGQLKCRLRCEVLLPRLRLWLARTPHGAGVMQRHTLLSL